MFGAQGNRMPCQGSSLIVLATVSWSFEARVKVVMGPLAGGLH
jgi:hypothetical protein